MTTRFNTIHHNVEPKTEPRIQDFETKSIKRPEITSPGQVIVQTTYVSVDPYMRFKLFPSDGSFEVGKPTYGNGMGRITTSNHPDYKSGDILFTLKEWDWPTQEMILLEGDKLTNKRKLNFDLDPQYYSALVGSLGISGLTAYFGLIKKGNPKPGETIVVSCASGSVGNVVAQLAKDLGLNVIGITRSEKKGDFLKELGISYVLYENKSKKDLIQELTRLAPDGIDIFFDNCGGEICESVCDVMKEGGRIIMCGQISRYNTESMDKIFTPTECMKSKNINVELFSVSNYKDEFEDGLLHLLGKLKEGKLKMKETRYEGIERWPNAFIGLFDGENIGKSVVHMCNYD